jgi:hypothetical protein
VDATLKQASTPKVLPQSFVNQVGSDPTPRCLGVRSRQAEYDRRPFSLIRSCPFGDVGRPRQNMPSPPRPPLLQ